jgi:hypothetical protein
MPQISTVDKDKQNKEPEAPKIVIKDESAAFALGSNLYAQFCHWRDRKRKIEEQWLSNLRAYNSVYDAYTLSQIDPNGSRQYIGITRMKTTAAYARLSDIIFPATGHKFWGIKPTPFPALSAEIWAQDELEEEDEEGNVTPLTKEEALAEVTKRMTARIHDQLVENNADTLIRAAIKDACTFGSGIIKAGMITVERKKSWVEGVSEWEQVKEDHVVPGMSQPSPFDVYFDINANSVGSSIGSYERHILNKEEVRDLKNSAGFKDSIIDDLVRDYPNGNHNREHHEIERQSLGNITHFGNSGYYEVLEYWGYIDGQKLRDAGYDISADKLNAGYMANVWTSGHKVLKIHLDESINKGKKYFVFPYEQIPNQLWGVGVPEIMMDSQDVLNAAFRRLLDDVAMTGNQLEINVDRLDDRSVNNANKIKPWKIWYRSGGDEAYNAITVHKVPSIGGELIQIIEMVRNFIDDETNLPSLISGQTPSSGAPGAETASGMSMLLGAAQVVIKTVVKNIDDYLIKPLITSYYNFNMEWSDDEEIKGDMNIDALGSAILVAREVQIRNMTEFLGITANEFDMPLVERPSILRKIARNMGLDEDDIKSDKKLREEAAKPDPLKEKLDALTIEKAELENAEIQGKIDVLASEVEKNESETKYKAEFLRQRRIKLAEDIKETRRANRHNEKEDKKGDKSEKKKVSGKAKPVKILNEA